MKETRTESTFYQRVSLGSWFSMRTLQSTVLLAHYLESTAELASAHLITQQLNVSCGCCSVWLSFLFAMLIHVLTLEFKGGFSYFSQTFTVQHLRHNQLLM